MKSLLKPVYKKLLPWIASPRYHVGSPWMNRLGLQRARVLQKQLRWQMTPVSTEGLNPAHMKTLDEEGVLIIPDFFSPEEFQRIQQECQRGEDTGKFKLVENKEGAQVNWIFGPVPVKTDDFKNVRTLYQENKMLKGLIEYGTRRKVHHLPDVTYEHLYLPPGKVDGDSALVVHADRHYQTLKTVLYLEDVGENKGGFAYYPKSHKITKERLQHESDISVREALRRAGKLDQIPNGLVKKDMSYIRPEFLAPYKYTQLTGKKNTMLIVNTCGFHARSPLPPDTHRKTLRMVFHFIHAPYLFQKIFSRIASPGYLN